MERKLYVVLERRTNNYAKDLDTGKEQSIVITADDRMSDAEIEQAMRDANAYAGQDSLRREALELSNEASTLIGKVQKCLTKLRVDTVTQEQIDNLKQVKVQLENSSSHLLSTW